jgi:hypothetical protein
MKLIYLQQNQDITNIVNTILTNNNFKKKCKDNFEQIFEDGVVDRSDVPLILNLFLTIYMNHNTIKVSKSQLKNVMMLLITRLLVEFKGDCELDEQIILLLIEPQIDILLMTLTNKCSSCSWCSSRPNDNESIIHQKMKLNKMEKKIAFDNKVKFEKEKAENERLEKERLEKEENERLEKERLEKARIDQEILQKEKDEFYAKASKSVQGDSESIDSEQIIPDTSSEISLN